MENDSVVLIVLGLAVLFLSAVLEILSVKGIWPQWLCRKLLHITAVSTCALAPLLLNDLTLLRVLVLVAEVLLFFLVARGKLFKEERGRKSWGIVLFPLPYLFLLTVFPDHRWLIAVPMLILAWSDAAAAIAGTLFAKRFFNLTADPKSLVGSAAFILCTVLILLVIRQMELPGFPLWSAVNFTAFVLVALCISTVLAAVEALGAWGLDNLYIPLAALLLLLRIDVWLNGNAPLLALLLLAAAVFVFVTIKSKTLRADGAITAGLMGISVVEFSGVAWLILPLFFFGSSMLIGKLFPAKTNSSDAKQGKARDAVQVLSNGGVYWLLALLVPYYPDVQLLMIVSMAIATSDTWASETGIGLKGKTYELLTWKRLPTGISGGVSIIGTLGGLLGALLIAGLGIFLLKEKSLLVFGLIVLTGFAGMLFDSLLGAIFQARYQNDAGISDEQAGTHTRLIKGFPWMSNDLVNLLSNVIVTALALVFL
jgi:uncharacterized protein (TIGR00297 family)